MENGASQNQAIEPELSCRQCGAVLHYRPGTENLRCPYCAAENPIAKATAAIEERDFERFLAEQAEKEEKIDVAVVACPGCGATVSLRANVSADTCPYCATSLVVRGGSTSRQLKPQAQLPFRIDADRAQGLFRAWARRLWFAPEDFRRQGHQTDRFRGLYVPYWTFDADTSSCYQGERGDHYYTSEAYQTTENGRTVTRTRQVQHTRWTPVSGTVSRNFDDVLVLASRSLPARYAEKLTPWDLPALVPFNEKFLSGFQTESYQVGLQDGFAVARGEMDAAIRAAVRADIGGDEQRVHGVQTDYRRITFKHILLPVWISSYRYGRKLYRFLVNGQSGEVQGERPWSWLKILLAATGLIGAIVLLVTAFGR